MEKVKTKAFSCFCSRRKSLLKDRSLTCSKCGKSFSTSFLKNGKCPACNAEEVFLRSISGDAIHSICSKQFSLNGGRE